MSQSQMKNLQIQVQVIESMHPHTAGNLSETLRLQALHAYMESPSPCCLRALHWAADHNTMKLKTEDSLCMNHNDQRSLFSAALPSSSCQDANLENSVTILIILHVPQQTHRKRHCYKFLNYAISAMEPYLLGYELWRHACAVMFLHRKIECHAKHTTMKINTGVNKGYNI